MGTLPWWNVEGFVAIPRVYPTLSRGDYKLDHIPRNSYHICSRHSRTLNIREFSGNPSTLPFVSLGILDNSLRPANTATPLHSRAPMLLGSNITIVVWVYNIHLLCVTRDRQSVLKEYDST